MSYLTYNLTLNQALRPIGTPTSDNEIANKAYVDTQITSAIDGIGPIVITNDDLPEDICKTVIGSDTFQGCTVADTFNLGNLTLTDNALTGPSGIELEGIFINNGVVIEPELRLQSATTTNSLFTNFSLNSSSLLLVSDASGFVTNDDYLLNNSNENQTQMCFLNLTNGAGCQFYNRVVDPFSGNLNQLDISQFHATGQNPTESITFRLGDTTGGLIGNGSQNINVLPTGTEMMKIGVPNTEINNNLIVPSIQTTQISERTPGAGINFNHGIKLPTSGGTANSLDYFEEFNVSDFFTGGDGYNRFISLRITRIGKIVVMLLDGGDVGDTQTTPGSIANVGIIPTRFRPTEDHNTPCYVFVDGIAMDGMIHVKTIGDVRIGLVHESFPQEIPVGVISIHYQTITWRIE